MVINLFAPDGWLNHLNERINAAREVGLLNPCDGVELHRKITCFLPNGFLEDSLKYIDLTCSLLELTSPERMDEGGWIERRDLFDEASAWLKKEYGHDSRMLLCEAGFAKIGDQILESMPYIIFKGEPRLHLRLRDAEIDQIVQLLRWARSLRVLGVVVNLRNSDFEENSSRVLFICDICDGDSLAFCPITRNLECS